jgi:hypothetical protein
MRRSLLLVTSVALLLATAGACSQDDPSADDLEKDVAEELQEVDSTLDQAAADCFAKEIVDELGADAVNDIDFSAEAPDEEDAEKIAAASIAAREKCEPGSAAAG